MDNTTPQPKSGFIPPVDHSPEVEPLTTVPKPAFSVGDWEALIGGKWALWVGSLCLFLAVSSFMPRTWAIVPPWAKVLIGMAGGFAMILAGGFLRPRTKRYFSEGLSGAGLSICYLSLWAGVQYFSVISLPQGFLGMTFLTAIGVVLAVRYDALSLSILSTLGGFLTPVLLHGQGGPANAIPFLTYILLLNGGILAVSLQKQWRPLVWLSFVCSVILVGNWWADVDMTSIRLTTFLFLTGYFVLYCGVSCFYSLFHDEETDSEDLLLLFASTSLYVVAGYTVVQPLTKSLPCLFPLGLAAFFGVLYTMLSHSATRNEALRSSTAGLALLGLTVAILLQFHQSALTVGWATEAGVLLFLSGRTNSAVLRRAGQLVWLLTSFPLLNDLMFRSKEHLGIFSGSALPLAVCVAASGLAAWNARIRADNFEDFDELELFYGVFGFAGTAWLMGQEIYHYFSIHLAGHGAIWIQQAHYTIAALLGLYSLLTYGLGLRWRHQTLRFCAVGLISAAQIVTAMMVFAPERMPGFPFFNSRVLSFLVIGVSSGFMTYMLRMRQEELSSDEKGMVEFWTTVSAAYLLYGATAEIFFAFLGNRVHFTPWGVSSTFFAISTLWSLAASLFLLLGIWWKQSSLRALGLMVGAGAVIQLLTISVAPYEAGLPLMNWRGAAFVSALFSFHLIGLMLRRAKAELTEFERALPDVLQYGAIFLLLWVLTQESYEVVRHVKVSLGQNWDRWGQMVISLVWSLFGATLLARGIAKPSQTLRLGALSLLALTVFKAFVFDLGFLNGGTRMLALGGLGISLIFISWLYSRFGVEKEVEMDATREELD